MNIKSPMQLLVWLEVLGVLDEAGVVYVGGGGSSGGSSVAQFKQLTDVPSAYTGQGGKSVQVKVDETGLEFVVPAEGVTDHGILDGLGDDDHSQYHTDARGDIRYYLKQEVTDFLAGKADTLHSHLEADITDLDKYTQAEVDTLLSGKADVAHNHDGDYVLIAGDTMTGDLVGTDFIRTRSGAITRVDGLISEVELTGGRTLTVTRDVNDRIESITDSTRTWDFTRTDDRITSWSVT